MWRATIKGLLAHKVRLGLIGASDSHSMQPGFAGLTCVMASELTRPAVFDSAMQRSIIATSIAWRVSMEFSVLLTCS